MQWYVLYLKPHFEQKAALFCRRHGFAHYLPLRQHVARYGRRRVRLLRPVFPGYLFAGLTPEQRVILLQSQYVVRVLKPRDSRAFLRQLVQVRRALRADPTLNVSRDSIRKGHRVRIMAGTFAGVEGVVGAIRTRSRVFLQVAFMQQSIVVEVSMTDLKLIE